MVGLLKREYIEGIQKDISKRISFLEHDCLKFDIEGMRFLGSSSDGYFSCVSQKHNLLDFYLNSSCGKEGLDRESEIKVLYSMLGVKEGSDFLLQHLKSNVQPVDLVMLSSLFCSAELYLKGGLGVKNIILPSVSDAGSMLKDESMFSRELKDIRRYKQSQDIINSVCNHFMVLGFGPEDDDFDPMKDRLVSGKYSGGISLEGYLRSMKD